LATRAFGLDLDGTLIEAEARQTGLAVSLASELNLPQLAPAEFWRLKREGASTRGALISLGWQVDDAARLAEDWAARIEFPEWLLFDKPLPGVVESLSLLRSSGFRPVVVTARRDRYALGAQLDRLALSEHIADVIVVDPMEAVRGKATALLRLDAVGYVGDTETDAQAAADGGVPFAAVSTGQRSETFLRSRGIDSIHASLIQAIRFLVSVSHVGGSRPR
jgi:phosphoglycolate phosphatase-like HAD superfamily hydrolase